MGSFAKLAKRCVDMEAPIIVKIQELLRRVTDVKSLAQVRLRPRPSCLSPPPPPPPKPAPDPGCSVTARSPHINLRRSCPRPSRPPHVKIHSP
ncbi:hypothetical protein ZWY2020_029630 [Hordeum vulgare]|nr:hypothetical protein ZWY2020_029630 [Hordeum vulgare]